MSQCVLLMATVALGAFILVLKIRLGVCFEVNLLIVTLQCFGLYHVKASEHAN